MASFVDGGNPNIGFSYLQGADRETGGNIEVALQILDFPFIMEAQNAQQVAREVLPSGRAYQLYTWEREGADEVGLMFIDVTTIPGILKAQVLLAPPDLFLASLDSVKESFQINGEPVLSELDTSTIAGLLGDIASPASTASESPATEPTSTSAADESLRDRLTPVATT